MAETTNMTLADRIKKAVDERNLRMVSKIVDTLRFKYQFNFDDTFTLFNRYTGINMPAFDGLMEEVDRDEMYG